MDGKSDVSYNNNKDGGGIRDEDVKKSKGEKCQAWFTLEGESPQS